MTSPSDPPAEVASPRRARHRSPVVDPAIPRLITEHELGSAYREVLSLAGGELGIARKAHLVSLFGGKTTLVHLDLEGRTHRAWLGESSYQRGLDGRVRRVRVDREHGERSLAIEVLPGTEGERVLAEARALVDAVVRALPQAADPFVVEVLRRAQTHQAAVEAERFLAAYDPIPILPPDCHRALVVQLTSGCSWNRCTFCHLYRDARFAMKSPPALAEHVRRVLGLLGRALPLRRGVFLGQANALVMTRDKLLPLLDVVHRELAGADAQLASLSAFVDAFSSPKRTEEWSELRARGVEGVSLGLESGCDDVLATLGKPAESAGATRLVEQLHEAGIAVGVIVLCGAGGKRWQARHVEATVDTVARMRLRKGDRVYLSPLHVEPGSRFAASLGELGALSQSEIEAQSVELGARLRQAGVTVPIARYDIRRFVY
ncbi:MAG: radical SAM protein [Polyangiaceae bacterium]|nr:radical SAM protein [Polyangiaceae bacterium]